MENPTIARARGVAGNPSAPVDVLLRLVNSGIHSLYFTAIYRRDLPDAVYDAIVAHPDAAPRRILADCWDAPAHQRARLVGDPDVIVRRCLAGGPLPFRMAVEPLPDDVYAVLARDEDLRVRIAIAEVRSLPEPVRLGLLADPDAGVRKAALLGWPAPVPDDVVQPLVDDPDPTVARWARLARPETAAAELLGSLGEGYEHWQTECAEVLPLTRELATRLVEHPETALRAAVAANPSLPADLVARLAVDPKHPVRLAVSMRPELTEEERAAIDYAVRPEDRLYPPRWLRRRRDDVELMSRWARSAHIGLRRFAACCKHLGPDLVALLARDDDFAVRLLLCENHPDAPPELLLETYLEARVITRGDLLTKPNFPRAGLAAFATSDDPGRRGLALYDPALGAETVERLSRDEVDWIRCWAARDRRLPVERAVELLEDGAVAEFAARHPGLPVELMHRLLDAAGCPGTG